MASGWGRYGVALQAAIASDRLAYAALALTSLLMLGWVVVAGHFSAETLGQSLLVYGLTGALSYGFSFPFLLLLIGLCHIILRFERHRAPAWRALFGPRSMGRVLAGTALMLATIPFRAAFNLVKLAIPANGGFLHDAAIADFDRALHGGIDPYHLVHAVSTDPLVLRLVELNYNNLWFVITFGALYWVAVSPAMDAIRTRFVLCFILAWTITGGVFAVLGSSAGPVYFGAVTGDTERFAPLVAFVDQTLGQPGSAAAYQHYLWDLQAAGRFGLGSGISAFPSMHVAIIAMLALFVGERSRLCGLAAWAYVGVTVFSSVYLGWHYAIDGYASIGLAIAIHYGVRFALGVRWRWADAPLAAQAVWRSRGK